MEPNRLKIIINNILDQVLYTSEFDDDTVFIDWLKLEVGVTDDELLELAESDCLPYLYRVPLCKRIQK